MRLGMGLGAVVGAPAGGGLGCRFVEMISMIVSFSVDKDRMRATVTWLGFRHVRYGVRPHHIPIMGQASPPYHPQDAPSFHPPTPPARLTPAAPNKPRQSFRSAQRCAMDSLDPHRASTPPSPPGIFSSSRKGRGPGAAAAAGAH